MVKAEKGQMKIQQMAFMLMAVVLFFILAGLFWISIQYVQLHKDATRAEEEKAIIAASFLGESAEFACSENLGSYCVDTDKLVVLKDKQAYKNFWPYVYIELRKTGKEKEIECNKANYPNCNLYKILDTGKKSTREARSFVALCRKEGELVYTKCELGELVIGYEVK
mgnify:CR=1 FL=1